LLIAVAFLVALPGLVLRLTGTHLDEFPVTAAFTFGAAIVGAAFLLTWAAEVAQMDISQGLALAFLALIAVLPEYAVDLYFAWTAAEHPEYVAYATANMTGANRLLIGIAWPLIVFVFWFRSRNTVLELPPGRSVELAFLGLATVYSFVIPLKGTISLIDTLFLVSCFAVYMWRTASSGVEEPELVGPSLAIGALPVARRRATVIGFFAFSAAVIFASAEPFAEALVHVGRERGIDEFLLVQWLAPLASESPEVVIACLLTWKGEAQAGMGAMVSAKVNQWTLLIGTLPLVYSIAMGRPAALHLDERQVEEIFLTAAQSLFAVAVLSNLRISTLEATALLVLFLAQFFVPSTSARYMFAVLYMLLSTVMIYRRRQLLGGFMRSGLGAGGG
jgi:cation:H+ antiporter